MPRKTIRTDGGASVGQNVVTKGDFVGRDQINILYADTVVVSDGMQTLVKRHKGLIKTAPPSALNALSAVIDEISKLYWLVDGELTRYLSVYFDPPRSIRRDRAALIGLEGGKIRARASKARGHCSKIVEIYQNRLEAWFRAQLKEDFVKVNRMFQTLSSNDLSMVDTIERLALSLETQATQTLALVDARDFDAANRKISAARLALLPYRCKMADLSVQMQLLQTALTEAANAAI